MRSTINWSILCLTMLLGCLFSAAGQAVSITDIYFQSIIQKDGISEHTILDIEEDQDGILWIATITGLHRYTGYDSGAKQYHPTPSDPKSLPSAWISDLFVDDNGTLWVGTDKGLARYNSEQDNFDTLPFEGKETESDYITTITADENGRLLVSTYNQIYRLTPDGNELVPAFRGTTLPDDILMIFNEQHRLWIGTREHGAFILNKNSDKIYSLKQANPYGYAVDKSKISDIEIINGEYWLATNDGIVTISNGGDVNQIGNSQNDSDITIGNATVIKQLGDLVWIGTYEGIAIYDTRHKTFVASGPQTIGLTGLTQKIIFTIQTDSRGALWAGTYAGLFRYQPELSAVRTFSNKKAFQKADISSTIWAIDEDQAGNLWFVTQNEGIGKFNRQLGTIDYYLTDKVEYFWDLAIDDYGRFWIASSTGICVYEIKNNKFHLVQTLFENNFVERLYFDDHTIWLTIENNTLASIPTDIFNTTSNSLKDNKALVHEYSTLDMSEAFAPIYSDNDERIWLSTKNGIAVFDPLTGKIVKNIGRNNRLNFNAVNVYFWRNFYWITTFYNGIIQVNADTLDVEKVQPKVSNDGVTFSSEGRDDSIWYTSRLGITRVDLFSLTDAETIPREALNANDFSESASIVTGDGALVFAGVKGFNILKKAYLDTKVLDKSVSDTPKLLELQVFGSNKTTDENTSAQPNHTSILHKDAISLTYDESRFSISYALVNPITPENVIYRYRMRGNIDEWFPAENTRVAQFNNVPFGDYVFEVQAKEGDNDWSNSRTLNITIGRPFWLHGAALVFYSFIVIFVLFYLLRHYQIRKQSQRVIKESEERLKLTLWSSGDELWDWDVYRGQVYRSNTWGTLDFPQDNIRTTSAYDANIHPNDMLRVQEALKAHLEGKSDYYELAYRAKTFSNAWIWILDRGKVVQRDHNQQPVRMTGTLKNIHHLKEAEEQLNLFKRSIENISEGVFITDTNFRFISVNNAYCSYTGESRDQALASYLYFNQYPEAFTEEIKKTLRTKGNWFGEVESVRMNGERYELELNVDAVHDDDGRISHFVGVFSDITSRKSTEKELLKLANTDPLTELPNRSFFQASHQNLVRKAASHALLCLDMDNFKKINDSLGHQTGDVLIKQIAKRLQRITGTSATCYRLGGDEFSVLMEDHADIHTITHFAQNILDNLSRPFIINKQEFVLGASVGIAFYPEDGKSPQEMLKNADTAMYFAKNNGGNTYKFFSGEMNQNAVRQLQIENLIRQGIKDDLFTVYYQPKVDIASGKLVSMEALVRFEHPQKGIVSPGQFIPLAEQTGQIVEIGERVLRKACADTKRWVNAGLFSGRVAVNISAKQFALPNLDDRIERILQEVGLSPLHLECEITEGTLMENPEQGLALMKRLRDRGIHLALDDFGTGYSSLAYLKRFPLNTLKIDKAFIDDIAESSTDRHMTAAIINIAHNLGLKVVAEGVEQEKQLTILRRYECEMLQGYLYSKPLNAQRFEKLLQENQKLYSIIGQHT
ncbi:EAL domain-containing protein [Alteromonas sp. 14N.309.X.WAT.G.H12]|uniref:EAL domain-containing protein n=1 Tax=Alteromonas sp. 14N.309.X.WAT.G.H12 TaxID=3120824 RepID=UPI002FD46639